MPARQRLRDRSKLLFDGAETRQLILRLDEMIDHLAHVFLDQPHGVEVGARRNAFEHATEALLELIEPFANLMKSAIGFDFLQRSLDVPCDFGKPRFEPRLIDSRLRTRRRRRVNGLRGLRAFVRLRFIDMRQRFRVALIPGARVWLRSIRVIGLREPFRKLGDALLDVLEGRCILLGNMLAQHLGLPAHDRDAVLHFAERFRMAARRVRKLRRNRIDQRLQLAVLFLMLRGLVPSAAERVGWIEFWTRHVPLEAARRCRSGTTRAFNPRGTLEVVRAA